MDTKEILMKKFVELGAKVPTDYCNRNSLDEQQRRYYDKLPRINSLKKYVKDNIATDLDIIQHFSDDKKIVLDGLPFMIAPLYISHRIKYNSIEHIKFIGNSVIIKYSYECDKNQSEGLFGDFKITVEKQIEKIANREKPDSIREKSKKEKNALKSKLLNDSNDAFFDIKRVNDLEFIRKEESTTSLHHLFYVLMYKDVWCVITQEEKEQMLIDIEDTRNIDILVELEALDVSNIKENIRKQKEEKTNVQWLTERINFLENRLRNYYNY